MVAKGPGGLRTDTGQRGSLNFSNLWAWEEGHSRCPRGYHVLKAVPELQLVSQRPGDGALFTLGQGPHLQTQGHAKEDPEIYGPCPTGTHEQSAPPPHRPVCKAVHNCLPFSWPQVLMGEAGAVGHRAPGRPSHNQECLPCSLGSRTVRPGKREPSNLSPPGQQRPPEAAARVCFVRKTQAAFQGNLSPSSKANVFSKPVAEFPLFSRYGF